MTRKLLSLLLGFLIGALAGSMLVMLFAPVTGKELRTRIHSGYRDAMQSAQEASQKRREELEAELARMRGQE